MILYRYYDKEMRIAELAKSITEIKEKEKGVETVEMEEEIDEIIYSAYQLSEEEKEFIRRY